MSWRLPVPMFTAMLLLATPVLAAPDLNELEEKALKDAVAVVAPSVVKIETSANARQARKGIGPTTGLVVSADGYIISSAFNFANKPDAIFITVPGQAKPVLATVVATDQTRMLTLLKIDATGLPVPTAVPKKDIRIGQWAAAVGRALDRRQDQGKNTPPSVSFGIISAMNRIWGKVLQTDAKVSPVNYGGPLVDIQGRVQGVLVPAAPRAEGETAGVEWYDSGIGFAVPMEDVLAILPRLKKGKDLKRGLLGITMKGTDMFGQPAVIGSIAPESAADKHGIKAGDTVVEIDGHAIASQAQLMHQLGSKYEGDVVNVAVNRSGKVIKLANIALSGTQAAKPISFLGVLPMRDDPDPGEAVRFVYPKSPADKAGLKEGDRILKIGMGTTPLRAFANLDQLTALLNQLPPGTEIKLEVRRKQGGKTETLTAKLAGMPDDVPAKLPQPATLKKALKSPAKKPDDKKPADDKKKEDKKPADDKKKDDKKPVDDKKAEEKKIETGLLKRASGDRQYWVYVPEDYDPNISHALVLWLHPVGKGKDKDIEAFQEAWEDLCKENHMILVAPVAGNDRGWLGSESEAVQQVVKDVLGQYTIDRQRVIAHGMDVGGQMAYYLAFNAPGLFRGVATTGAVLASQIKDSADQRLAFFLVAGTKDPILKDIQESKTKLTDRRFSVIYREIPDMGHQYLTAKALLELGRWIDSLDRQ